MKEKKRKDLKRYVKIRNLNVNFKPKKKDLMLNVEQKKKDLIAKQN